MSVERDSKVSVTDSLEAIFESWKLEELERPKPFYLSSFSVLLFCFTFMIFASLLDLAFPAITNLGKFTFLRIFVNFAIGFLGIHLVLNERQADFKLFSIAYTIINLINLGLMISELEYFNSKLCLEGNFGYFVDDCRSQANAYLAVGSFISAMTIIIIVAVPFNIFNYSRVLRSKISTITI
jgi:hypothetical protein